MADSDDILARALADHRAGRPEAAEPVYRRLVADDPSCHAAWHLLGIVALQRGEAATALEHIERAAALVPDNGRYATNLGVALATLGRTEAAIAAFERAATLDPTDPEPPFNIATLLHQAGDTAAAERWYRRALTIGPDHALASNNLGALLKDSGQAEAARTLFERAVAADPDCIEAITNLGRLAEERGDVARARQWFDRALAIAPDEAIRLKRALLLPVVYRDEAEVAETRQEFEAALARAAAAPPQMANPVHEGSRATFFLAYQGYDDRRVQEQLAALYRGAAPALDFVATHCRAPRRQDGRIRVGFVSKHLCNHTIGKLNRGLIAGLPRADFEVTLFPVGTPDDALAREIAASADRVIPLPQELAEARTIIADQAPNILYYPDIGMEPFTYFLAFARLAPVQCTTWGHPVTSGLDTMDYFISTHAGEVPEADDHYRERLVRFERFSTCYRRPERLPRADRAGLGLPAGRTLYLCPQTLFKLHPAMDGALAGIVAADPRALIVLIDMGNAVARDTLERRWRENEPELAGRVLFVPRMSEARFMALLTTADVMLDPFPFCGGNTSLEAFAQDVPIVTLPTRLLRGRLTAALYAQMGLDGAIAASVDDYARLAVAIATEPDRRAALARDIAERSHALFDDAEVIAEFAAFFTKAAQSASA